MQLRWSTPYHIVEYVQVYLLIVNVGETHNLQLLGHNLHAVFRARGNRMDCHVTFQTIDCWSY